MLPNADNSKDLPTIEIETFTPEEMGWVKSGERAWALPDGTHYIFAPGQPELIEKLVSPIPKYKPGDA